MKPKIPEKKFETKRTMKYRAFYLNDDISRDKIVLTQLMEDGYPVGDSNNPEEILKYIEENMEEDTEEDGCPSSRYNLIILPVYTLERKEVKQ